MTTNYNILMFKCNVGHNIMSPLQPIKKSSIQDPYDGVQPAALLIVNPVMVMSIDLVALNCLSGNTGGRWSQMLSNFFKIYGAVWRQRKEVVKPNLIIQSIIHKMFLFDYGAVYGQNLSKPLGILSRLMTIHSHAKTRKPAPRSKEGNHVQGSQPDG